MDLIFLPILFVAMWFLLIRPQQNRMKAQRNLISSLQAGDRVVTAGGIIGTIKVLGDTEMRLEVSPGVELELVRGAVSSKLGDDEDGEDDDVEDDDEDQFGYDDEDELVDEAPEEPTEER